jgi:hypothetical protein
MTQAVCFKCGDIKWGAFNHCEGCGTRPKSDDELMLSLAFTDHYFDLPKLQQIGHGIAAGTPPQLAQSFRDKLYPAVQEAKAITGIGRKTKQEKPAAPKRRVGILGGIFLLSQGVIWIGPPLYAGHIHAPWWFVLVWSATLGSSNVMTGWRYQTRGIVLSLFHATIFASLAVIPLYLIGRWLIR